MHDSRNVTKQCQEYIEPEVLSQAHLQEHTQRRQKNGNDNADEISQYACSNRYRVTLPSARIVPAYLRILTKWTLPGREFRYGDRPKLLASCCHRRSFGKANEMEVAATGRAQSTGTPIVGKDSDDDCQAVLTRWL